MAHSTLPEETMGSNREWYISWHRAERAFKVARIAVFDRLSCNIGGSSSGAERRHGFMVAQADGGEKGSHAAFVRLATVGAKQS